MHARKPDFFIIGAPKCGTTSLAAWLDEHPSIFISKPKEPHYFNFDDTHRNVVTLESYEALFARARAEERAGEASTWYLTSKVAVREILEYQPQAKLIVMLRNPLDLVASLHQQNVYAGYEDVDDVAAAWRLQEARLRAMRVPPACRDARHLQYGDACSLGRHLERVLASAPPERVLCVFLEDVATRPAEIFADVVAFVGAPRAEKSLFDVRNAAKTYRSKALARLLRGGSRLKSRLGMHRSFGLSRLNAKSRPRPPMPPAFRKELKAFFEEDVALLSSLTGRNLEHWLD